MIIMAKVEMEDGTIISSSHLYDKCKSSADEAYNMTYHRKRHRDVSKLKVPSGRTNGHRLLNINTYDLLAHIQETLSMSNRCIIELITNEDHRCLNMNKDIQRRIHRFAGQFIDDEFRKQHPRSKVKFKISADKYDTRDETDEEWFDRLCHIFMHKEHPQKLQMIKCEECLQKWLNSSEWTNSNILYK